MIRNLFIIFTLVLVSCSSEPSDKDGEVVELNTLDTTSKVLSVPNNDSEFADTASFATFFVVIADTSQYYSVLQKMMFYIHRLHNIPIDTMGRYYNKTKNLIALPDNDEDEMYAGDYFPRRFPSEHLSLEYLNFYQKQSSDKTIALVTGIYETERVADSALTLLQETERGAFKLKSEIYVGCMH